MLLFFFNKQQTFFSKICKVDDLMGAKFLIIVIGSKTANDDTVWEQDLYVCNFIHVSNIAFQFDEVPYSRY